MQGKKMLIYPLIFSLVLAPFLIIALLTFRPASTSGGCAAVVGTPAPHVHGSALDRAVVGGMLLLMNVGPAVDLYQVVDGALELCGGGSGSELKHITLDVVDAQIAPGERLPVTVSLTVRDAGTGEIVLDAAAPAMYAPGHGYHFGDNYRLAPGATYAWTFSVSPVEALRQAGAHDLWLEPVTWSGSFSLDAAGNVTGQVPGVTPIGDFTQAGLHITLGQQPAVSLYAAGADALTPQPPPASSRYFVVDVTDHSVNYEQKLPGATVTLTFRQGATSFDAVLPPVISPVYGFHYGANIALEPGTWEVTVQVEGLDFLRHAGAAVSLPRRPVSASFTFTVPAE